MADFNSEFWSWFISAISLGGIAWLILILRANSKVKMPADGNIVPTGHVWDEDIEELNTPLPRWWLIMFYVTIVFGLAYLALYPGLGSFQGFLGWSQKGAYETEVSNAKAEFGPLYDKFINSEIPALAADDEAMHTGKRLFANYCAVCHGSDARGATGFPNLRDDEWIYGGTPEMIKASIMHGRTGAMPSWEAPLGGAEGVENVANYVMRLSGRSVDDQLADAGKAKFDMFCVGCHMADGTGNQAIGAPNLANNIWLYGGSPRAIKESIAKGRSGRMPAHDEFLGEAKVHVLAAYIYSLSFESD